MASLSHSNVLWLREKWQESIVIDDQHPTNQKQSENAKRLLKCIRVGGFYLFKGIANAVENVKHKFYHDKFEQ